MVILFTNSKPGLRSGAEAGRTPCQRGSGQEELSHVQVRGSGQECQAAMVQEWLRGATPRPRSGQRPRVPGCKGAGTAEKTYPSPRSGAVAGRSYPPPEARAGSCEEQTHVQGAVAAWMQEGLDELFHVQGQEGHW